MARIERFEEILSWKEARLLNLQIGEWVDSGRFQHSYKLAAQLERSAGSIMDNIAEGFRRDGNKELVQFLYIAKSSCGEFRSQLYRALDRKFMTQIEFNNMSRHAMKINSLIQKLVAYLQESTTLGIKYKAK